jgi:hypothetical protein
LPSDASFQDARPVVIVAEKKRQIVNAEPVHEALQNTAGNFSHAETADLKQFDALTFGAELSAAVNFDAIFAARFLISCCSP